MGKGGEIQLTSLLLAMMKDGEKRYVSLITLMEKDTSMMVIVWIAKAKYRV